MKTMQEIFDALSAPLPQESIRWRAQTVYGGKALALAYVDSRDVMDILDRVCGPGNWQSEDYGVGTAKACKIGIKDPESGEWIWKSDGSGDTDIEADKGGFSGAFKRAAVKWGIARYLYDMKNVWVPCALHTKGRREGKFKEFIGDPWKFVNNAWVGPLNKGELTKAVIELREAMNNASDVDDLGIVSNSPETKKLIKQLELDDRKILVGGDDIEGLFSLNGRLKKQLTEQSEFEGQKT